MADERRAVDHYGYSGPHPLPSHGGTADDPYWHDDRVSTLDWSKDPAGNVRLGALTINNCMSPGDFPYAIQAMMAGVAALTASTKGGEYATVDNIYGIRCYKGDATAILALKPTPTFYCRSEVDPAPMEDTPCIVKDCKGRTWVTLSNVFTERETVVGEDETTHTYPYLMADGTPAERKPFTFTVPTVLGLPEYPKSNPDAKVTECILVYDHCSDDDPRWETMPCASSTEKGMIRIATEKEACGECEGEELLAMTPPTARAMVKKLLGECIKIGTDENGRLASITINDEKVSVADFPEPEPVVIPDPVEPVAASSSLSCGEGQAPRGTPVKLTFPPDGASNPGPPGTPHDPPNSDTGTLGGVWEVGYIPAGQASGEDRDYWIVKVDCEGDGSGSGSGTGDDTGGGGGDGPGDGGGDDGGDDGGDGGGGDGGGGENQPPVTVRDEFTFVADGVSEFNILDNDTDPEGDPITLLQAYFFDGYGAGQAIPPGGSAAFSSPNNAANIVVHSDGRVEVTGNGSTKDISGSYAVTDGNGPNVTGTISITSAP